MSEIPFWVHDRPKWVSGITKSTTCQDVLHALVLAERKGAGTGTNKGANPHLPGAPDGGITNKKKEAKEEEVASREISKGLVLVEQWRGVERPLSNSSKVVKLWQAWGEERSQVRFVVKRISMATSTSAGGNGSGGQSHATSTTNSRQPRSRPRRRNSRASATSDSTKKATDTVHPSALPKPNLTKPNPSSTTTTTSSDLERLMRIILTQGETIHWQLKKLQDREGQIESIEHEVHQSRTKTAGKDYLLNAYLSQDKSKHVQSGSSKADPSSSKIEATTEGIHEILEALSKVFSLNEKITEAEEKAANLENQLTKSPNPDSIHAGVAGSNPLEVRSLQGELKDLRTSNDQAGREIDQNRHLISSMRLAYDERKALMAKLEKDVDTIELEGQRLQKELRAIQSKRQEQTFEMLSSHVTSNLTEMDLDGSSENSNCENHSSPIIFSGGFLDSGQDSKVLTSNGHYQDHHILTSEQLYEGPQQEPGALYDELQRRLRITKSSTQDPNPDSRIQGIQDPRIQDPLVYQGSLHDLGRLGLEDCLRLQSPDNDACNRIKATGSPGSNSSSGNSSGSGASYEKSVRFNDRQMILSTPELPDLALPTVPPSTQNIQQQQQQRTKSILKPGDTVPGVPGVTHGNPGPGDNTDSNSDTGLSSLHSSSDEGTYVLDTLV